MISIVSDSEQDKAFLEAIKAEPLDWATKAIYADFIEEYYNPEPGFALAFAYRWMAKNHAHPYHRTVYPESGWDGDKPRKVPKIYSWAWYRDISPKGRLYAPAYLNRNVFNSFRPFGTMHGYYGSFEESVQALANGLDCLQRLLKRGTS